MDYPQNIVGSAGGEPRVAGRKRVRCNVACTVCRHRKVRCDGNSPCGRCMRLGLDCTFDSNLPCSTTSPNSSAPPMEIVPRPMSFGAPTLDVPEFVSIKTFFSFFHPVIPLASTRTVQAGMNQFALDAFGDAVNESERAQDLACRSVAWSTAALGSLLQSPVLAERQLQIAIGYLRETFDRPSVESLSALMGITECLVFLNNIEVASRYARFTHVHYEDVKHLLSEEMKACYAFMHCHLFAFSNRQVVMHEGWRMPDDLSDLPVLVQYPYTIGFVMLNFADIAHGIERQIAPMIDVLVPARAAIIRTGKITFATLSSSFMAAYLLCRSNRFDDALQVLREAVDLGRHITGLANVPIIHILLNKLLGLFQTVNDETYVTRIRWLLRQGPIPSTEPYLSVPETIIDQMIQLAANASPVSTKRASEISTSSKIIDPPLEIGEMDKGLLELQVDELSTLDWDHFDGWPQENLDFLEVESAKL